MLLASVLWFIVRPLRRRVTDDQVALYLEEHEPSLQATLVSAVEASRTGHGESAALIRRVVEQAIAACQRANAPRTVESKPLRRYGVVLAGAAVVAVLAVLVGPAFIRQGLSALFLMPQAEAAARYRIEVTPGSSTVPKGSDQTVAATLLGFDAEDANLMVRRTADGKFEPLPLARTESGTYEGLLFDINGPLDYFVEADGVRSETYSMKVVEVPYVQRLELEFVYPAYTGLEPQKIEDGGDIAVLRGATVKVHVIPTMKTPAGRLIDRRHAAGAARVAARRHARRELRRGQGRRLRRAAAGAQRRVRGGLAEVHHRRARRRRAHGVVRAPGPRHHGVVGGGSVRRGQGRGRLRRPQPRAGVLGERRGREGGAALPRARTACPR